MMSTKRRALVAALMTPMATIVLSCVVGAILEQPWFALVLVVLLVASVTFYAGVLMVAKGDG